MLICWEEDFKLGIARIDFQHARLVQMINKFFKITQKNHLYMADNLYIELRNYAHYHYATEELMAKNIFYNAAKIKKISHNDFLRKLQKFYDDFKNNDPTAITDTLIFLQEWIPHHITVEDVEYIRALKNPA